MPVVYSWDFDDGTSQGWTLPAECSVALEGTNYVVKCSYSQVDSVSAALVSPQVSLTAGRWYTVVFIFSVSTTTTGATLDVNLSLSVLDANDNVLLSTNSFSYSGVTTETYNPAFAVKWPDGGAKIRISISITPSTTADIEATIDAIEVYSPDQEIIVGPKYALFIQDVDAVKIQPPIIINSATHMGGYLGYLNNEARTYRSSGYFASSRSSSYLLYPTNNFDLSVVESNTTETIAEVVVLDLRLQKMYYINYTVRSSKLTYNTNTKDEDYSTTIMSDIEIQLGVAPNVPVVASGSLQGLWPGKRACVAAKPSMVAPLSGEIRNARIAWQLAGGTPLSYEYGPVVRSDARAEAPAVICLQLENWFPEGATTAAFNLGLEKVSVSRAFGTIVFGVRIEFASTNYDFYEPVYQGYSFVVDSTDSGNPRLQAILTPMNVLYLIDKGDVVGPSYSSYYYDLTKTNEDGIVISELGVVTTPVEEYYVVRNDYGIRIYAIYSPSDYVAALILNENGIPVKIVKPGETLSLLPGWEVRSIVDFHLMVLRVG